ncbi:MerR family transcriptional regulator [Paramicrobacterium agarici]|uniref:MerR-like DNA binding protein n=1 Tax=Paramicrobacterium agarici TaxID=630514 RepID=A0A2A9DXT0_9MICO|nr:MerR family transcriptional regulator [Microbacterium agarici]PFG30729.1 MerR-like DNA binding protein [Microbacterium agarici]TQO23732.1 MerR-like DNA binding protein [Microbacterium agarici]
MRISELSRATGVSIASIKYYVREGLLPAGESLGARQADYGDTHVTRLRLIRALVDVVGLPIAQVRRLFALIADPGDDMFAALGEAVGSLPPYGTDSETDAAAESRARATIERLDWTYDAGYAATAQLERSLAALEGTGVPMSDDRLEVYARAARMIAEFDIAHMPDENPSAAIEYSVLGTALYEPVLVALRRLAHLDIVAQALDDDE